MKKFWLGISILLIQLSVNAQKIAEDYYDLAYYEMYNMLIGQDLLSIKRAAFLAEWAYYEGELDYNIDFCNEIDRIVEFVNSFYEINNLNLYKTGKQMALNEYFFRPYSGNQYKPYTYDFDDFLLDDELWESQFVSKVLITHKGQCRSLPWLYKIIANEISADVYLAYALGHCYIMYRDEDMFIPEDWINLELTSHQMQPTWWIKYNFEINDSALLVGTYMTPLTDMQTVAKQMADLALGYIRKFHRYDEFTFQCASASLDFFPMNPNAWIIRIKSLEQMIKNHLFMTDNLIDDYTADLISLLADSREKLDKTYMTEETKEMKECRR